MFYNHVAFKAIFFRVSVVTAHKGVRLFLCAALTHVEWRSSSTRASALFWIEVSGKV